VYGAGTNASDGYNGAVPSSGIGGGDYSVNDGHEVDCQDQEVASGSCSSGDGNAASGHFDDCDNSVGPSQQ
jgi:hypothetical protein